MSAAAPVTAGVVGPLAAMPHVALGRDGAVRISLHIAPVAPGALPVLATVAWAAGCSRADEALMAAQAWARSRPAGSTAGAVGQGLRPEHLGALPVLRLVGPVALVDVPPSHPVRPSG